jgi:hypothetical protein
LRVRFSRVPDPQARAQARAQTRASPGISSIDNGIREHLFFLKRENGNDHEIIKSTARSMNKFPVPKISLVSFLTVGCSALLLATVVLIQLRGPYIRRSFEFDELITLRYYTAAGINPDGRQKTLERIEDIRSIGRIGIKEFCIGAYCSFGRWNDANNHILNSFLMNCTFLFLPCSEQSSRIPAMAGLVLFAAATFFLIFRIFRCKWLAPLGLMLAVTLPYSMRFSQTSRGYLWMLCLQTLLLIALYRSWRNPASKRWVIASSSIAVVSIMNIISTVTFIVLPVYLSMAITAFVFRRTGPFSMTAGKTQQVNIFCQVFFISALCSVFFMDRLPYLASLLGVSGASFYKAGDGFNGAGGFFSLGGQILQGLFPSVFWKIFGLIGMTGLVLGCRSRRRRTFFISLSGILTVPIVVIQAIATHQFGYERTYGFFMNYALIGFIIFCKDLVTAVSGPARKPLLAGLYVILGILLSYSYLHLSQVQKKWQDTWCGFLKKLPAVELPEADANLGIISWNTGAQAPESLYFPKNWHETDFELQAGQHANIALLITKSEEFGWHISFRDIYHLDRTLELPAMDDHTVLDVGNSYRVVNYPGRCHALTDSLPKSGDIFVIWYIDPASQVVTSKKLLEHLARYGLRYFRQQIRYQAKLSVFGRITDIVLFSENEKEFATVLEMIRASSADFGGKAIAFVPDARDLHR